MSAHYSEASFVATLRREIVRLEAALSADRRWRQLEAIRGLLALYGTEAAPAEPIAASPIPPAATAPPARGYRSTEEYRRTQRETAKARTRAAGLIPWDDGDGERLVALHHDGKTPAEIAPLLGPHRSRAACFTRLRGMGLWPHSKRRDAASELAGGMLVGDDGETDRVEVAAPEAPAAAPLELRPCGHCRVRMTLKPGETPTAYRQRIYCDRRCQLNAQHARQREGKVLKRQAARDRLSTARTGDDDQIARFLAEKGATIVMSPEQVGNFLRDVGYAVQIRELGGDQGRASRIQGYKVTLDGQPSSLSAIYAEANRLRAAGGLPPVSGPVVEFVS